MLLVSISYCNAQCEIQYGTGSMESLLSSRKKADRLLGLNMVDNSSILMRIFLCNFVVFRYDIASNEYKALK